MPEVAYLALGSNLGDRAGHLVFARRAIDATPGCRVVAESSVEETAPLGGLAQPAYLNQMLAVETDLSAAELLAAAQAIEQAAGRERAERWGPRTLDIDIVLYDDARIDEAALTVPHPGLESRDFWQRELDELRSRA